MYSLASNFSGAGLYGKYVVMLVGCSPGISWLALLMGRRLTPVHDAPQRTVVVASGNVLPEPVAA